MATHPLVAAVNKAVLALGPELDRLQAAADSAEQRVTAAQEAQRAAEWSLAVAEATVVRLGQQMQTLTAERDAARAEAAQLRDYFARLDKVGAVFAPVDVPTLEPRKPILEQLADAVKAGTL